MKAKTLLLALAIMVFAMSLSAAPRLINYQGMLTDKQGKPITTPVEVTFTFWDAETGGNQLGAGFSDMDSVTPDADGIYSTLIGDDPGNLIPESVFSGDSVWLNVNIAGDNLANRMRITSAGFAINAMNAGHATTADSATTATKALGLAGALNNPGDRMNLGANAYFDVNAAGNVELIVNGQRYRLGTLHLKYPSSLSDNISPDGQTAYSPQVAMDNNGNAIVTWYQSDGAKSQIFKSEYRNGVWTHPSSLSDNISQNGQDAYGPQVAMDNNSNAIITWFQSDGTKSQTFKSEYRGGVWTHPASISDNISPDGQDALSPRVAMDDNGNAIITWFQSDGTKNQIFKSEYRNGVWTHPLSLLDNISPDGQNAYDPRVAMDNNVNAIITWRQSDGLNNQIFKSEYRGGGWTHPPSLSDNISPDGQGAYNPQVAMDNNVNAIITWYQSDGSNDQIFKSEYLGGVWTHPSSLSDNISPDGWQADASNPQVAMDSNGNAIITWYQSNGSKTQIFKSEYRGGVWTHPASISDNISPDGQNALNPQVAMDNNGNAIIIWYQSDGSKNQIFMSEYRWGF
ncbi:MAG: hypothetical protein NT106_07015 [Candidatus Sumerlaeota bacterium]|nr:hypothetical protein [Candidatus Sumerlaeota bacterium]